MDALLSVAVAMAIVGFVTVVATAMAVVVVLGYVVFGRTKLLVRRS